MTAILVLVGHGDEAACENAGSQALSNVSQFRRSEGGAGIVLLGKNFGVLMRGSWTLRNTALL